MEDCRKPQNNEVLNGSGLMVPVFHTLLDMMLLRADWAGI